jgi:hypothetical protein
MLSNAPIAAVSLRLPTGFEPFEETDLVEDAHLISVFKEIRSPARCYRDTRLLGDVL